MSRTAAKQTVEAMRPEIPKGAPDPLGRGYVGGETRRLTRYVGGSSDGARSKQHVIAPTKQARFSNDGTVAHAITPRGPGYPLRFYWPKVGAVVYPMRVSHPGNAAGNWWPTLLRKHWPAQLRRALRSTSFRG